MAMNNLEHWAALAEKSSSIDNELYAKFDVKRGLRNADQTGVLVGLTNVGTVVGVEKTEGGTVPVQGRLEYRGIGIDKIVHGKLAKKCDLLSGIYRSVCYN